MAATSQSDRILACLLMERNSVLCLVLLLLVKCVLLSKGQGALYLGENCILEGKLLILCTFFTSIPVFRVKSSKIRFSFGGKRKTTEVELGE